MNRLLTFIFVTILFFNNVSFASETFVPLSDEACRMIIKECKIDPKIKSQRGWRNVFKSDKWLQQFHLDEYTLAELECIKEHIIANAMNVKSYNRYLGMEIKL